MEQNNNREIDVKRLLKILAFFLPFILLTATAFKWGKEVKVLRSRPVFQTKVSLYAIPDTDDTPFSEELVAGTSVLNDCKEAITSRSVIEKTIAELNLREDVKWMSYTMVKARIAVTVTTDNRFIVITVSDQDPYRSYDIAKKVAELSVKQINGIMGVPTVAVTGEVFMPTTPVYSDSNLMTRGGYLTGLTIAIILVILLFLADTRIRTAREIKRYLGLEALGEIPASGRGKGSSASDAEREAYNALRAKVLQQSDKKVIMLTGCRSGEAAGKAAQELAGSLARSGYKTLLVDADLPGNKETAEGAGRMQVLSMGADPESAIRKAEISGLYVLPANGTSQEASDLIASQGFGKAIEKYRDEFDYVIIEAPAAGEVSDALRIAQYCDGILLVIAAESVRKSTAERVAEQLKGTGCPVIGTILSRANRPDDFMLKAAAAAAAVLLLVCLLLADVKWKIEGSDKDNMPKISIPKKEYYLDPSQGEKKLLEGITAYDPEDGDVTDSLRVSTVILIDDGTRAKILICAKDSANNVSMRTMVVDVEKKQ